MPVDNRKFNHPYVLQNPGCAEGHIHIHVRVNGDTKIETIYVRLYTRYTIVVWSLIKRLEDHVIITTQPVSGRCWISKSPILDSFKAWNNVGIKGKSLKLIDLRPNLHRNWWPHIRVKYSRKRRKATDNQSINH